MPTTELPTPAKSESRTCFGVEYFTSEADADRYAQQVRDSGQTYNGGFFHGLPCGRSAAMDHTDPATGVRYYAVTVA